MLTLAKAHSTAGKAQSSAIYNVVNKWSIADKVMGMSFNTLCQILERINVLVSF